MSFRGHCLLPPDTTGNFITGFGFDVSAPTLVFVDGVLLDPAPIPDIFGVFNAGSGVPVNFADALFGFSLAGVGQLYTGPADNQESNPTFLPGVYNGIDPNSQCAASLTISAPEPSALLMLLTGLVALFGTLALRKVSV